MKRTISEGVDHMHRVDIMKKWKKHKSGRIYWNYMGLLVVIIFGELGYEEWSAHRMRLYGEHFVK